MTAETLRRTISRTTRLLGVVSLVLTAALLWSCTTTGNGGMPLFGSGFKPETTGVPGAPDATTTIDGRNIPAAPQKSKA